MLLSLLCLGCKAPVFVYGESSLKIFLTDVDGLPIEGATVLLEGDGVPVLKANYQRKEKFYFFNLIPKGYHTILANHKAYNPKGYKNNNDLPNEITLTLFTPYRVQVAGDSSTFYMEDPYQLVLGTSTFVEDDRISDDDFLAQIIHKTDSLTQTLELERIIIDGNPCNDLAFNLTFHVFQKKDGTKFKRFNSPIIERLRAQDFVKKVGHLLYLTKSSKMEYITETGQAAFETTQAIPKAGPSEQDKINALKWYSSNAILFSNYLDFHLDKQPDYINILDSNGQKNSELDFRDYKDFLAQTIFEEQVIQSNLNRKAQYYLATKDQSIGLGANDVLPKEILIGSKRMTPRLINYPIFCKE